MKSSEMIASAENLIFAYQRFELGPLTFSVSEGDRVSVIGANGSGKTTLLNLLSGLKKPDKGRLALTPPKNRTALLSDQLAFPSHWTLQTCVRAFLQMKGAPESFTCEDPRWRKTTFSEASKGMKMQVLLKAIAIQKPTLLICDEPSSGLDPVHQQILLKFLRDYEGTLVMSTHYFSEMQKLGWTQTWLLKSGQLSQTTPPSSPDEWAKAFEMA